LIEIQYIKLSELTLKIENLFRDSFNEHYWVVAEISGHKFYANSDRHYFDLVEKIESSNVEAAKIKGKSWSEGSQSILFFEKSTGQKFQNGLQVLIKVKVEYHSIYGLSVTLMEIDPSFTLGNLEKQRRDTLARLLRDNEGIIEFDGEEYITANKKLNMNSVLQNIALVASHNSEGYIDFIHTIEQNKFGYCFHIDNYFSSVQGGDAEKELVKTLVAIYNSGKKYDAVVIIRGGGAKTDFLVFDTYNLSRAVAKFPVPVITGIGHHKDVSIVDMMAHTSTKTPTKAAEFIISHNHSFEEHVSEIQKSLIIRSQQILHGAQQRINALNNSIINNSRNLIQEERASLTDYNQDLINTTRTILFRNQNSITALSHMVISKPGLITGKKLNDLSNLVGNIRGYSQKYLSLQSGYLAHHSAMIKMMRPENILKKGFALVSVNGKIVKDATSIQKGDEISVQLSDAELKTKVISKSKKDEQGTDI
jgi:exodeoxyribonuclease VII large subunit